MQIKVLKSSKPYLSSHRIREHFLDFFVKDHGHKFIRSSPVVPFCDNSIAFVNAGMNQFKNVFLGNESAPALMAANSQKCIRVGGKHNDLNIVGTDGYHHTFFEMLGNWSFGSYFKRDACTLAYNLLTGPYKINPARLYVTYFGGDAAMKLEADLECREIWREIGIPPDRILPFGKTDNFWEMGPTGPCGPCTEIHFDHISTKNRAVDVNQGLPDLTELWNLVFIQYNRDVDGKITNLPEKHIDTGMGFERLAAILQEKSSNYDTDLFMPIFDAVQKATKAAPYSGRFDNELDRDYRIIADHARMVTACIADGMFPDHSYKLSRILKKIILISERTFKSDRLLLDIIPEVAEILGPAYPEMNDVKKIQTVVQHEIEVYSALRKDVAKSLKNISLTLADLIEYDLLDYPGFIPGYKDLMSNSVNFPRNSASKLILPVENALKLSTTYGLDAEAIGRLCDLVKMDWNETEFHENVARRKKKMINTTRRILRDEEKLKNIPGTDDSFKYNYEFRNGSFHVPSLTANIIEIIDAKNGAAYIITDKTNFYVESGGQECDHGFIQSDSFKFKVTNVYTEKNFILHFGHAVEGLPALGTACLTVDQARRNGNIRHHTATHLLNAAVRKLKHAPTCQKSSGVFADGLKLELSVYGPRLNREDFQRIETECRDAIQKNQKISTEFTDFRGLLDRAVTMVPGEIYPDHNLRLIQLPDSAELCCGTHASETGQLIDFCLTNVKLLGRASYQFTAIAGEAATRSHQLGEKLLHEDVAELERNVAKIRPLKNLNEGFSDIQHAEREIRRISSIVNEGKLDGVELPYVAKSAAKDKLIKIEEKCRVHSRQLVKLQLDEEDLTKNVVVLKSKSILEELPLQRINWNSEKPLCVIAFGRHVVFARCAGPIDAKKWMDVVANVFKSTTVVHEGFCRLKEKNVSEVFFDTKVKEAVEAAENYLKQR